MRVFVSQFANGVDKTQNGMSPKVSCTVSISYYEEIRETRDAAGVKQHLLDEANNYQSNCERYEKKIIEINKEINAVEDDLDHDLTEYKDVHAKLEIAEKESREAELQVNALRRRLALAEEEKMRCEEKTWEAEDKFVSKFE